MTYPLKLELSPEDSVDLFYDRLKDHILNLTKEALEVFFEWYGREMVSDNYFHLMTFAKEHVAVCKDTSELSDYYDGTAEYDPIIDGQDDDDDNGLVTPIRLEGKGVLPVGDGSYVVILPEID